MLSHLLACLSSQLTIPLPLFEFLACGVYRVSSFSFLNARLCGTLRMSTIVYNKQTLDLHVSRYRCLCTSTYWVEHNHYIHLRMCEPGLSSIQLRTAIIFHDFCCYTHDRVLLYLRRNAISYLTYEVGNRQIFNN